VTSDRSPHSPRTQQPSKRAEAGAWLAEKHVNRDPRAPLSQMSSHIGSIPIHSANQRDRDPRSARAEPLSKPAYPFAAAMCCGLNDPSRRTSSDAQVSVGQHHVIALSEREHQLRPSVADARFSLVLQIPRSAPGRISSEARKIASGDIHLGATTPATSQRAPCPRCEGRRTAILARGVEAPSAKRPAVNEAVTRGNVVGWPRAQGRLTATTAALSRSSSSAVEREPERCIRSIAQA
jgi:hypothetical protein